MNARCYALNLLRLAVATRILPTVAVAEAEAFLASGRRDEVPKGNNIIKV